MRSMVEGLTESESPSTAFHAVPLPIAFGDRDEREGRFVAAGNDLEAREA